METWAQDPQQRLFQYFFDAAVIARVKGDNVGARDLLTEAYLLQPKSAAVMEEFAHISDNPNTSLAYAREAVRLEPDNYWYKSNLAELYVIHKQPELAAEVYEELSRQDPNSENIDYILSTLYLMTRQPRKALNALNNLEKKMGIDEYITSEKFRIYELLGEKDKAEKEFERLCERFPYNTDYQLALSQCYYAHDKRKKAEAIENEVRKKDPGNEHLRQIEMERYREAGDTIKSDSLLLCALNDSTLSMEKKMEMLNTFLSSSNPQDVNTGEKALSCMVAQFPDNELLHAYYSSFLLMQRRLDEAISELKEIIRVNPNNEIAWLEYIVAAQEVSDTTGYVELIDNALRHFPKEPLFLGIRAIEHTHAGNLTEALALFNEALALTDDADTTQLAQWYLYRGDAYALMNDYDNALDDYQRSYLLNKDNPLLLNNYAYYIALSGGDLIKAERMSAKAVNADPDNVAYLDTYAWICHLLGDDVMARLYIQQAYDKGGAKIDEVISHYNAIFNDK